MRSTSMEDLIMYRTLFPRDLFAEFDHLQRAMQQSFDISPSIRGLARGANADWMWPALNVGSTAKSVEIYCFAPGLDPASIEVQLDKDVLTIAGQRTVTIPDADAKTTVHIDERFAGRFRHVITLPDDIDANAVSASYDDGVLHVSVQRQEAVQPRRITVQ